MPGPSKHLARAAQGAFERRGDYDSLVFEGRSHRSGDLFARASAIATGLGGIGLVPGDRVVVTMANCPEVGIVYQAIWRAGLVATPATFLLSSRTCATCSAIPGARCGHDVESCSTGSARRSRRSTRAARDLHRPRSEG